MVRALVAILALTCVFAARLDLKALKADHAAKIEVEDEEKEEVATEEDLSPNDWHARESLVRRYIHHRHANHVDQILDLLTDDAHYHILPIVGSVGEHNYRGQSSIRHYLEQNRVADDEIRNDESAGRHPTHRHGDHLRVAFEHWEGLGWAGMWVSVFAEFEFRGHGSNTRISKITAGADTR